MTNLQFKVFSDTKIDSLVYRTLFTNRKIFGFYADISHKLVSVTSNVFQVELNNKPKTMHKILNYVITNLLLMRKKGKKMISSNYSQLSGTVRFVQWD